MNHFSKNKCQQRSRVAASRFGVEAAPLQFRGSDAGALGNDGFVALKSLGALPTNAEAALALINEKLPDGATPLLREQVYIHFLEAANSNFVGDRALYLGDTTLQNIAAGAQGKVAFMNAHRTGGLSAPSELPFGQTFCGLYEEGFNADGLAAQRATVGVFMLAGVKPNGDNGPSTSDLDAGMKAGTIADVSVGLGGGERICNVCGHDLAEVELDKNGEPVLDFMGYPKPVCPHVPGTHAHMTDEEIAFEQQRDPRNTKGVATYTLHNAELGEVSAVYDGAVPGAGVKRVMEFARHSDLSKGEVRAILEQAYEFYGSLLPFDIGEIVSLNSDQSPKIKEEKLKMDEEEIEEVDGEPEGEPETEPEIADEPATLAVAVEVTDEEDEELASAPLDATPENIARLQSQLAARSAQLSQVRVSEAATRAQRDADARTSFASSMREKIAPVARPHFNALFAATQDHPDIQSKLETALAKLPKNAKFAAVEVELSEVMPPAVNSEAERDRKAAEDFATRRNNRKKPGASARSATAQENK